MEPWALKAMQRWPNVPALFGWLSLDRRGRWLIKNELISRPQIIDTISANYGVDEHGRWYFQNGPQRGYLQLAYAPFVVHLDNDQLVTHTRQRVQQLEQVYVDEEGSLLFVTEFGPAVLLDTDLDWALTCIYRSQTEPANQDDIEMALALPSGTRTSLLFIWNTTQLLFTRLDYAAQPEQLGFVRDPQPHAGERTSVAAPD